MKRNIGLILALTALMNMIFVCCTKASGNEAVYVYGMGIEDNKTTVKLYVLAGKENSESSQDDSGKSSDKEKNSDKEKMTEEILTFEGQSIENVFDEFFASQKDIYTGTNKIYALQTDSEDFVFDFKVYLTNSNKLPAKIPTVLVDDAYTYLKINMQDLKK